MGLVMESPQPVVCNGHAPFAKIGSLSLIRATTRNRRIVMMMLAHASWMHLVTPPVAFAFLPFAGLLVVLACVIGPQWRKAYQSRMVARLVSQMLERGFTADEIERVLERACLADQEDRGRSAWRRGFLRSPCLTG